MAQLLRIPDPEIRGLLTIRLMEAGDQKSRARPIDSRPIKEKRSCLIRMLPGGQGYWNPVTLFGQA
jgi:hypothetical protein